MKKPLLLFISLILAGLQFVTGQTIEITGKISAAKDGETFPGATIMVIGTTIGTITDFDGNYRINVPEDATELEFKYVGMKTVREVIEGRTVIDVLLEEDILGLEEVIVVGYGQQLKTDLTGSISKIKPADLNKAASVTMETALQGVTSGVHIEQASGKLGESVKMRIRGSSSISADNQPLYVVDGIPLYTENTGSEGNQPTNPLSQFNFNDVESIEILKDASAAAIYGSRAANGVVMITTKRGKMGKTNIDLNFSQGVSQRSRTIGFLNAKDYRELFTEAAANHIALGDARGFGTIDSALNYIEFRVPGFLNGTADENWEEEAFRTGMATNFDLSASGGNEKTTFYTGVSYVDQKGIIINNRFRRASARINLDHNASDKIRIGMNTMFSRTQLDRVANDNAFSSPMQLSALPSVQPIIDPATGELNTNTIYFNGLIAARDNWSENVAYRGMSNIYFTYEPIRGLTWRSDFGADLIAQKEDNFLGRNTNDGEPDGNATSRSLFALKVTTNNYLTYNINLPEDHWMEIVGGMSFENIQREWNTINATGFPSDAFQTIASATTASFYTSAITKFAYVSYFARANYKLKDKYLLGVSIRRDGSSRFGEDSKYGTFPSASLGWILSREDFLASSNSLSFLKARASYGVTGNSGIDNYAHLGTYVGADYAGVGGIRPWSLPSPDLRWETTGQMDMGIDYGFFRNRINGEIDYYVKKTTDLLLARTLPATSGYTAVTQNIGELENKGWEFMINTNNTVGEFKWNTSFNISGNKNKIISIAGPDIIADNEINRVREGEPIGVFVTREYAGVDPSNGHALYYFDTAGVRMTTDDYSKAGNYVVGDPNPKLVGGMTNSFKYKGFDLNILISWVVGNKIYNRAGVFQSMQASNGFDSQTNDMMDRWQKPGDVTDVPIAVLDGNIKEGDMIKNISGTNESSRYIYDGSYIRLKSISLGYNLPQAFLERASLRNMRFYLTVTNLFTFTKYKGWDPEVNYLGTNKTTTNANVEQGIDLYTAPQARTVTIGLTLGL